MLDNTTLLTHIKALVSPLLDDTSDDNILPHLERAKEDFINVKFANETLEKEAIACKTLYYYTPVLWLENENSINEMGFNVETIKDMQSFMDYWLNRAESVYSVKKSNKKNFLFSIG